MRVATSMLLLTGAGAIAVGVWLLAKPELAGGAPPEAARAPETLLAVGEVSFPAPLGGVVADAKPPTKPPKPPVPPAKPPVPPAKPPVPPSKPPVPGSWVDTPPAPLVASFDDGKLPGWLEQRVATGVGAGFAPGVGDKVVLSFERLRLMSMLEGHGGAVVTRPLAPVRGHCLVVKKRTRVHPGRELSAAETSVLSADGSARLGAVLYVRGPGVDGFLVGDEREHATGAATWDAWFDETITYDPLTGALFHQVDGGPPRVHEQRPAAGAIRVGLAASGRGLGHVHDVDRLEIGWKPCQLGEGDGS